MHSGRSRVRRGDSSPSPPPLIAAFSKVVRIGLHSRQRTTRTEDAKPHAANRSCSHYGPPSPRSECRYRRRGSMPGARHRSAEIHRADGAHRGSGAVWVWSRSVAICRTARGCCRVVRVRHHGASHAPLCGRRCWSSPTGSFPRSGRGLGKLACSESGPQSHFWTPVSTATAVGKALKLIGYKSWVTSAGHADVYVASCRSSGAEDRMTSDQYAPLSGTPGFTVAEAPHSDSFRPRCTTVGTRSGR